MKRIIALLFAVCLCLGLTACGDPIPAELTLKNLKIAVICSGVEEEDYSAAAAILDQLESAGTSTGLKKNQLTFYSEVSINNIALAEEAIEECVLEGNALIFSTNEQYAPAMKRMAEKYPRVTFIGLGDADPSLKNYFAFHIKMYEGAYLCGLTAGMQSEKGKLGLLVSTPETDPETCQIANAFLLGAQVINKKATLDVYCINTTKSDAAAESAIQALHNNGCDTVLIAAESAKALETAQKNNMHITTLFLDAAQKHGSVTYAAIPRFTDVFVDGIQAVLTENGTPYFNDGYYGCGDSVLSCSSGSFADKEISGDIYLLPDTALSALFKADQDVFSGVQGKWKNGVFTTSPAAITDANGNEKIAAGAGKPTKETLDGMTWLIEGIVLHK